MKNSGLRGCWWVSFSILPKFRKPAVIFAADPKQACRDFVLALGPQQLFFKISTCNNMLRQLIGTITGLVSGGIASTFFSSIGAAIYPKPSNFDATNVKLAMDYFQNMPNSVRFLSLAGLALGAFVAGLVAAKIAIPEGDKPARKSAILAGFGMLLFQTIGLSFQSAQPWWYCLLSLAMLIPVAILGGMIVRRAAQKSV